MQLTTNTRAFIEAEQYSDFILTNLHDGLLPGSFYRNVSDFGSGETLHIKTIGTVTLQEAAEDTPLIYNPIETGEITMKITDYVGDAWYVTDDLREDGAQVERLTAARAVEQTRAFQEYFETRFLETIPLAMQAASPYAVNGFAHKIVSADANGVATLDHFRRMQLAFDKANVPSGGRVAIVDPTVAATLAGLVTITSDITAWPMEILKNGFERDHRFITNLFGWNIITSNRLYRGTGTDGTTSITDGVWNIFMSVADDNTKPVMYALRRPVKVEGERNKDRARDEYVARSRYGLGVQRLDTAAVLITHPTNIDAAV
jgi:hypothetical protein